MCSRYSAVNFQASLDVSVLRSLDFIVPLTLVAARIGGSRYSEEAVHLAKGHLSAAAIKHTRTLIGYAPLVVVHNSIAAAAEADAHRKEWARWYTNPHMSTTMRWAPVLPVKTSSYTPPQYRKPLGPTYASHYLLQDGFERQPQVL